MASAVGFPLPFVFATAAFPLPLPLALVALFAFFSAAGLPLPFLAGAAVDLAGDVGLILDRRLSPTVDFVLDGLAVEGLGALVGLGGLTTSLYGPVLAGLAGGGLALTGVDLVGAAFPLTAFF